MFYGNGTKMNHCPLLCYVLGLCKKSWLLGMFVPSNVKRAKIITQKKKRNVEAKPKSTWLIGLCKPKWGVLYKHATSCFFASASCTDLIQHWFSVLLSCPIYAPAVSTHLTSVTITCIINAKMHLHWNVIRVNIMPEITMISVLVTNMCIGNYRATSRTRNNKLWERSKWNQSWL